MGVVGIILMVVFIIVCVLMIAIVLIQDEEGNGLGGLLGGTGTATFGSKSSNVLTKTTYVLVALFFVVSFALAFINKAPKSKSLDSAIQQTQEAQGSVEYWNNGEDATIQAAPSEQVAPSETE